MLWRMQKNQSARASLSTLLRIVTILASAYSEPSPQKDEGEGAAFPMGAGAIGLHAVPAGSGVHSQ